MATPVSQERTRLGPRAAAMWDEYRQRNGGNIPNAHWGQVCGGLETYAFAYAAASIPKSRRVRSASTPLQ